MKYKEVLYARKRSVSRFFPRKILNKIIQTKKTIVETLIQFRLKKGTKNLIFIGRQERIKRVKKA